MVKQIILIGKETEEAMELYRTRKISSAADVWFTSACNAKCTYCDLDSGKKDEGELTETEKIQLIQDLHKLETISIQTCGKGEPLLDKAIKPVIEKCSELGISYFMFTNGTLIDQNMARFLYRNKVSLLVKLDSLNSKTFDDIYGVKGLARKTYHGIENLLQAGYSEVKETDNAIETRLGVSIVITQKNISDIPEVVRFCKEKKIYPLIAKEEDMGRASKNYQKVGSSQLTDLLGKVNEILGYDYRKTIYKCPSIIGFKIDNVGNILVSGSDSMGCAFTELENIKYKTMGNIRTHKLKEVWETILDERSGTKKQIKSLYKKCPSCDSFSGCGDRREALESYLKTF